MCQEMEQGGATQPVRRQEVLALLRGYREWRRCRTTREIFQLSEVGDFSRSRAGLSR